MAAAPPNNAGIPLPPFAQHPPTFVDITNVKEYTERLRNSKRSLSNHAATDDEIGLAERHLHLVVMENSLMTAPGTTLGGILNQILTSIGRMEARLENALIGRVNRDDMLRNGATAFRGKVKQVTGDGTILANLVLPQHIAPLVGLQVPNHVGAVPMPVINTRTLTHQDILTLIQFYNEDFGIEPGDTVPTRTQKVANWLTATV